MIDKEGKIAKIESGGVAIDPTGAYEACDLISFPGMRYRHDIAAVAHV